LRSEKPADNIKSSALSRVYVASGFWAPRAAPDPEKADLTS